MKKVLMMTAALALTACSEEPKAIGMANPASEYCVKQGGTSEIKKDAEGNEYGVCHLPDGTVVNEWDYYRQNNQ